MPEFEQSDVEELLAKMAKERSALLTAAESLSDTDADRVPQDADGEEQWTAKEQLAHLWEMEHAYIAWVRAAVAEDGVAVDGVRGEPGGARSHRLLHPLALAARFPARREHRGLRRAERDAVAAVLLPA